MRITARADMESHDIKRYGFINENSDLDNLQPAINVLKSEELIYYIDSIVVIYSPWLHTQRYFLQHINHISCLTVDYEGTMVATGERHDNQNYLASLDNSNDHVMLLWDLKKSKVLARISLNKMAIRRIIYARAFQIFTIGRFILNVWKINIFLDTFEELNQISYEKLITLSENSTEIFEFTSVVYDQNKEILITGDSLNNITMWNLNLKIIRQIFQTHESCVTALFFNFNKLISGGKDGYLKYWNHLTCDLLAVIKIPYRDGGIAAIQLLNNNIYLGTDTNAILKVAFKTDMTQKNFLEDDNMFSTFELNTDNYILTAVNHNYFNIITLS
ncbi:echinoderm microtubule-associated protein-like 1 [Gordionus sp. m RMFG-2023]|uniref:echinoderm microtubule-associated protein-like 1 n=1 Tax=Gordionus sp. m RMFG-2023 TaxID=3053472 RepID=UPI0031FD85F1